jgi:hypothetical protein
MEDTNLDVKQPEDTEVEPSTTENTPAASEGVKTPEDSQEKSVPYERFQEVVKQKNTYKELLESKNVNNFNVEKQAATISNETGATYEESLKLVKDLIKQEVSGEVGKISKKIELDKAISDFPDFYKYAEQVKAKVKENPYITWEDAYKLAKFDVGQTEAKEIGRQEAYKTITKKQSANVEGTGKVKSVSDSNGQTEIDVFAKGPDGKFLYSLAEIADILPKT